MRQHIVDPEILSQMLQEGKSQRECAQFFKVSEAAISKRAKRMRQEVLPDSFLKLTLKERQYALAKVEGKSNTAAAIEAYNVSSTESAHTIGVRLSKDEDVNTAIADLMAQEGIGRRHRVQRLRALIDAKDLGIVAKGLDLGFKLAGDFAPEKVAVATMTGLSPEMEDLASRLMRSINRSQEGRNEEVSSSVTADLMPPIEIDAPADHYIPNKTEAPSSVEVQQQPVQEPQPEPKRRPQPWTSQADPYAPRMVPMKEWERMAEEELRNRPVPGYDPFSNG